MIYKLLLVLFLLIPLTHNKKQVAPVYEPVAYSNWIKCINDLGIDTNYFTNKDCIICDDLYNPDRTFVYPD